MPLQTADAQHFALMQRERRIAQPPPARQCVDLEREPLGAGRHADGIEPVELASDHFGHDLVIGGGIGVMSRDGAAVAENRQPVSDSANFAHAMRNEDRQPAFLGDLAAEFQQPFGLDRGEGGRRLVEDQNARVLRERFGDLHDLPFGQRQVPQLAIGPDCREPVAFEQCERIGAHALAVGGADKGQRLMPEPDVLLDRQIGDERKLLEYGRDAQRLRGIRIVRAKVLAVDVNRSRVVAQRAGQDLDERALAGAVLAEQRMHFAGTGRKRRLAQRDDAAEPLAQAFDVDQVHADAE